jgi:hypothetical protein
MQSVQRHTSTFAGTLCMVLFNPGGGKAGNPNPGGGKAGNPNPGGGKAGNPLAPVIDADAPAAIANFAVAGLATIGAGLTLKKSLSSSLM